MRPRGSVSIPRFRRSPAGVDVAADRVDAAVELQVPPDVADRVDRRRARAGR